MPGRNRNRNREGAAGLSAASPGAPGLLVEASSDDGTSWTSLSNRSVHNAYNLKDGSGVLKVRITASTTINLTAVTTSCPQVLSRATVAASLPLELPAGTPVVITLPNADPGVAKIVMTFSDDSTFDVTITGYTLTGKIRAATAGGAPEEASVCGAPISASDVAAATTHANPTAACTASDDGGDWIVLFDDTEFEGPIGTLGGSKASRLCCDDSVKPTGGCYGDGGRIASAGAPPVTGIATGATVRIHEIGLFNSTGTGQTLLVLDPVTNVDLKVERCRIKKSGTYDAVALVAAGCDGIVANCYIEAGAGSKGVVQAGFGGNGDMRSINNTILAIGAAHSGCWSDDNTRKVEAQGTYVGVANGQSFSGAAFVETQAGGVGGNGSSDTSAPGSTAYPNLAAADFIADDTAGAPDLAVVDRETLEDYPCPDASLISCRDVDGVARTDWFMGAKWLPPAA